jgi:hypothetical protein
MLSSIPLRLNSGALSPVFNEITDSNLTIKKSISIRNKKISDILKDNN